jgi:hypothetical protein
LPVALAHADGAAVLVVVSPAPMQTIAAAGAWNAWRYRRLIARYRTAVEQAGGTLVDLHDAVDTDGFHSTGGFIPLDSHLNGLGAVRVADKLGPAIVAAMASSVQ